MNMNKRLIFKHYWKIALAGTVAGIILILHFAPSDKVALIVSLVAAALGFCYFSQQQKLAETALFKQLFTEFNQRYDEMNSCLAKIAVSRDPPDPAIRQKIVDYFNLCAEEYLFFCEGYIHPEAWRSWCTGMPWYFKQEPFKTVWAEEVRTNSYYGLSVREIEKGAA
jgi:hypothetical protein